MIKRTGILILLMLYMASVPGFALNLHYCGDRIASVKLDVPVKKCISLKSTRRWKCCKSKTLSVKVKDAHQHSFYSLNHKLSPLRLLPQGRSGYSLLFLQAFAATATIYRGPPPSARSLTQTPAYLKNRVLRI